MSIDREQFISVVRSAVLIYQQGMASAKNGVRHKKTKTDAEHCTERDALAVTTVCVMDNETCRKIQ